MKKIYGLIVASLIATAPVMAQHAVECDFTSISSNITTNTTLSSGTLYRLEGCIHVTTGVTLTIPAGTKIMGMKSNSTPGALIIDKGATLTASGTSGNPIVFTSDQTPTNKGYGDWVGLIIEGKATNNVSGGIISIENRACSIEGGVASGANDADNSGTLQYIRIEYAKDALTLLSVGTGTTLDNVQASYTASDAFQFLGGTVNAKYLISLNARGADFRYEYGNRSKNQYLIAIRLATDAHLSSGDLSNSIVMANNESGSSYSGTPKTHPVLSNVSLLGPTYCGASGISSDFKNAVLIQHNSEGGIYNSFISGWPTGVMIADDPTITNALTSPYPVSAAYNSFSSYTTAADKSGTWSSACATSISNWINGSGICSQPGNQFPSFTSGYSSTICGNYASATPTFTLSSSGLDLPDYTITEVSNAFFDEADDRGAINTTTDWTTSWANWNPQAFNPCPGLRPSASTGIENLVNENAALQIAPNPADGVTYALFDALQAGTIKITVVNSVGQVVRTVDRNVEKGSQRVAIKTDGLSSGIYNINIAMPKGGSMRSKLVVK